MKREATFFFVFALTLGFVAAPLAVEGQQAGKVARIGILSVGTAPAPEEVARSQFLAALRDLRWIAGQNIVFEARYAEGQTSLLPALAAELVRLKVDLIVTFLNQETLAAKQATPSIPRRLRAAIGLESAHTGAAGTCPRRVLMSVAKVVKLEETEIVSFGPLAHYQPIIGDEEGTTPIRTGIQTSQPGYEAPMHSHPYLEILHILDGTAEAWQEGREDQKVLLRKGDTIELPPGVPHSFRVVGQEVLRLLGTHVSPKRIVNYRDGGASDPHGYRVEDR